MPVSAAGHAPSRKRTSRKPGAGDRLNRTGPDGTERHEAGDVALSGAAASFSLAAPTKPAPAAMPRSLREDLLAPAADHRRECCGQEYEGCQDQREAQGALDEDVRASAGDD